MHYVIQENIFREEHYDMLEKTLKKFGLPYDTVRIFPFFDHIVNVQDIPSDNDFDADEIPQYNPPFKDIFAFGAVKMARIASKLDWTPGSLMTDNHDFSVYSKHYGDNLLNHDSIIIKVTDKIQWKPGEEKFMRPTQDTKSFAGKVFNEYEWNDSLENGLKNHKSEIFNENTEVQVSTVKHIQKEIRFWVVGGKIITGSIYKIGNQVIYDERYDEDGFEFAQRMVDIFQLADAFCIDVCLCNDEWKIVECGCINCCGFYKADMQKLIIALEDHFGSKSL